MTWPPATKKQCVYPSSCNHEQTRSLYFISEVLKIRPPCRLPQARTRLPNCSCVDAQSPVLAWFPGRRYDRGQQTGCIGKYYDADYFGHRMVLPTDSGNFERADRE